MSEIGEWAETVPVSLTCIGCGKTEIIHVFRERELPGSVCWECFNCQAAEDRREGRPKTGGGCRQDMVDPR